MTIEEEDQEEDGEYCGPNTSAAKGEEEADSESASEAEEASEMDEDN